MEKKRINWAVSELFGALILLAIVTSVMALIFYQISTDKGPYKQTFVKLVGKIEGTKFILENQGGDSLGADTSISLALGGKKYNYTVGDILEDTNHNGFWNLGERLVFPYTYNLSNLDKYNTIDVMTVDKNSNSIQFFGSVQLHPIVDLGITSVVSNSNPHKYDTFTVTLKLTCNGGDINGSANIKVQYLIPQGLQYISSNPALGTYDNATGIWFIPKLIGDRTITCNITLKVMSAGFREFTQFALIIDGSGSIQSADWQLIQTGVSTVLANSSLFPNDGSVELTVIQFGNPYPNKCKVEISPTIITASNYQSTANYFKTFVQGKGGTPMAAGIYLATDTMRNSINFNATKRQIILMVTDGKPTYWSDADQYVGQGDGSTTNSTMLRSTENARNYSVTHLGLTADKDQFDVFAVGVTPDIPWLNNSIIWPHPGYIAPPFNQTGKGWVSQVSTWQDFSNRISLIFKILFQSIPLKAEIISAFTSDPNPLNNMNVEMIIPST
jgi:uncharacterized protein YegL